MGVPRVKTELSVSYVDHNTLQEGFENADDHLYLQTVAARHGIYYSRAGNGICHQVHLERFGAPGKTLLGSDSHTPTGGGIGMMAIGAGGVDVAVAMAGGPFFLTYPRVIRVNLTGMLQPWVSAKDVILKLLEILTTKGNVGCVVEYGGGGGGTPSVPQGAANTNMGGGLGVTTSIFPSDKVTKAFLKGQGRQDQWVSLKADPTAKYDRVIDIDLSRLEPMVAQPHSPDNVTRVKDIAGKRVDQVLVGSCTNASYKDITTLAKILNGKVIRENVSFGVAPGSRQVLQMAAKESSIATLVSSGARIFLVSPETAAACALKGEMADPRDVASEFGIEYPDVKVPKKFLVDDSMVLPPAEDPSKVTVRRGPNIGNPPESVPLPETIRGEVTLKTGDKVTTDHIMPAGARLKYRSNIGKYAEFVFEGVDPTFSKRALENKAQGVHNVVVGGLSYGQGSSREHAAICPSHLGVRAVITKSFERIHSANLINFGIVPLLFANEADYERIDQGDRIEIPDVREAIRKGQTVKEKNVTKGFEFETKHTLTGRQVEIILAGGCLAYTKEKGAF